MKIQRNDRSIVLQVVLLAAAGSIRKYGKKTSLGLIKYDVNCESAFCRLCKTYGRMSLEQTGGVWTTMPFTNWKNAVEKMKAHGSSDAHIKANQAAFAHLTT